MVALSAHISITTSSLLSILQPWIIYLSLRTILCYNESANNYFTHSHVSSLCSDELERSFLPCFFGMLCINDEVLKIVNLMSLGKIYWTQTALS